MVPVGMFMKALASGASASPLYVVFFVTERCTASCGHCLLGNWDTENGELSIEEIERWARKMPDFYFFLPTGGEPFLRADLPEIVSLFVRHCSIQNAGIPTNGSLTEQTVETVNRILAENPSLDFAVDVSFDGIGADHDSIRCTEGLFDKAVATFEHLKVIAERNPRFNLNVAMTVSALNQDKVLGLIDFLVDELGARNINHLLVRGEPRDPAALDVDLDTYRAVNRKLEKLIIDGRLRGYSGYSAADSINAMKLVRQDAIEKTMRAKKAQCICRGGTLGAVVRANGDILPCETLDSCFGNLREADYDFMKLWISPEAKRIKKEIVNSRCFCSYECFMTLNVITDPALAASTASRLAQLKASRLLSKSGGAHVRR